MNLPLDYSARFNRAVDLAIERYEAEGERHVGAWAREFSLSCEVDERALKHGIASAITAYCYGRDAYNETMAKTAAVVADGASPQAMRDFARYALMGYNAAR